jgi:hypothetical protein
LNWPEQDGGRLLYSWEGGCCVHGIGRGEGRKKGVEEQTAYILVPRTKHIILETSALYFIHSASGKQWNLKLETMRMCVL